MAIYYFIFFNHNLSFVGGVVNQSVKVIFFFYLLSWWTLILSCAVRELDVPGELYERKAYPFEFSTVEMPFESYNGVNVRLR